MKKKKAKAQKKKVKQVHRGQNSAKRAQNSTVQRKSSTEQQKKNNTAQSKRSVVEQQRKNNTTQSEKSVVEQQKKNNESQRKRESTKQQKNAVQPKKSNAEQLKKSSTEQPRSSSVEQPKKSNTEQRISSSAEPRKGSCAEQRKGGSTEQPKSSSAEQQKSRTERRKGGNAESQKNTVQPKKSSTEQLKNGGTEQLKKGKAEQSKAATREKNSNTGHKKNTIAQSKSSSVQKKGSTERSKGKTEQKGGEWKEVLYNCPYVLGIVFTSLIVMFFSDEIGFKAIAREAQAVMVQSKIIGDSEQTDSEKHMLSKSDEEISADESEGGDGNLDTMENNSETNEQQEENAGKRKGGFDDKKNDNDLENDTRFDGNPENIEENIKNEKGITKFEIYDPQEIDSIYYSDAGKIALTTEYPYIEENISYFDDAAFLGDSRTLGISDYAGLEKADFYCDSGMMIFKLLEEEVTYQKTGNKVDLNQVLQEKKYGKIYIMLGMNELGYGNTEMYLEQYRKVVEQIREWQPQAIIYIMANLHVSREKNNMETEFNNVNINDKNAASAQLANGTDIFYLDANPLFTDKDGFLNAELTFDGVHLYAQHYDVWREFLLEHAVEPLQGQNAAEKERDTVQ